MRVHLATVAALTSAFVLLSLSPRPVHASVNAEDEKFLLRLRKYLPNTSDTVRTLAKGYRWPVPVDSYIRDDRLDGIPLPFPLPFPLQRGEYEALSDRRKIKLKKLLSTADVMRGRLGIEEVVVDGEPYLMYIDHVNSVQGIPLHSKNPVTELIREKAGENARTAAIEEAFREAVAQTKSGKRVHAEPSSVQHGRTYDAGSQYGRLPTSYQDRADQAATTSRTHQAPPKPTKRKTHNLIGSMEQPDARYNYYHDYGYGQAGPGNAHEYHDPPSPQGEADLSLRLGRGPEGEADLSLRLGRGPY